MKLEFSWHIYEKYSNTKFPVGTELFHTDGGGGGDRHGEAKSRISQFRKRA